MNAKTSFFLLVSEAMIPRKRLTVIAAPILCGAGTLRITSDIILCVLGEHTKNCWLEVMRYGMRSLRYIVGSPGLYEYRMYLTHLSLAYIPSVVMSPLSFHPLLHKKAMAINLCLRMAASRGKRRSLTGCVVLLGGRCRGGGR